MAAAINWTEFEHALLVKLNIAAEYQALRLELAKDATPDSHGWVKAHAFGIADRTPSAAICVMDGPYLGVYKDFRQPGLTASLIKFYGRVKGCTRGEVFKHFATKTGEKLPGVPEDQKLDNLVVSTSEVSLGSLQRYAERKAGYSVRAMKEVGILHGTYSKKAPFELRNQLFLVPMFGTSALLELEPTGYHCFADVYGQKIRQYRGKGNQPELLPVMSVGPFGLMNVDGLQRLPQAEVVNICEGISDTIAMQAVLGPWRDGATESDPRKHVVLTTGGCSNYIKEEWAHHFEGKIIHLWPDVGDSNNAGVNGMAVQLSRLLPVAKAVMTIKLPLGKDGGKNDVRAWLTEAGTDRGYAEVLAYAATFQPHAKDDKTALLPSQKLLKDLGLTVLGGYEGSKWIEVYSEFRKKGHTIHDLGKFQYHDLIQLVGEEVVLELIHDGREPQDGLKRMSDVKNAVAQAASDSTFLANRLHGGGIWLIEDQIVLDKWREVGILKGDKIEICQSPLFSGRVFDISHAAGDWVDFNALNRYLAEAQRDQWCRDVFEEGRALFAKWYWKQDAAPPVLTSLTIATWLQSLWVWRPEVFLTSATDTGKSMLLKLLEAIFGGKEHGLATCVEKPTEAAIRQHLKHHSKIIIVDEFEDDEHRKKIMELFRTAGRGGTTIRGTADQRGVAFQLKQLPWFAAIETGLRRAPDKNRYLILDLEEIPKGIGARKYQPPSDEQLKELGLKLLAVGLRHIRTAKALVLDLKGCEIGSVPGRVIESFAVPAAMYAAIHGLRTKEAELNMRDWMADFDFSDQAKDEEQLLSHILTSMVKLDHGLLRSVAWLLSSQTTDSIDALARAGIRRVTKRGGKHDGEGMLFIANDVVRRGILILNNSEFAGANIDEYLKRLKGTVSSKQRLDGRTLTRGIEIPETTVGEVIGFIEQEAANPGEPADIEHSQGF